MRQTFTNMEDTRTPSGRPQGEGNHVPNNLQDGRRTRTMERQFEHGRHPDLPNFNRDIPRKQPSDPAVVVRGDVNTTTPPTKKRGEI